MTTELTISPAAERDLGRLERPVAQRIAVALRRYVATGIGDVQRLTGSDEWRLRVGDWRVRFVTRMEARPAAPPATGTVSVRVIEVLHVLPRGRAYRR